MQSRSSRCSPSITLWVLKKGQRDLPLAMRSRLVPMPSNFLTKVPPFARPNHQTTKPPEILTKPKTQHNLAISSRPKAPLPFPTPNLSTAKRSAPTIQIAKGADPMAQIQIQSHPPDSHHKAVPWVMPHTNGRLPDPEFFSGWTAGCWWWDSFSISSIPIVYILHPESSFPAAATKVIQYQYQTFRASSGCFGFANGHAQSWSVASLNFWIWCLLDIGRRCD